MTAAGSACGTCGTELREYAKFCDECGAPTTAAKPAEYKQVTVLFADVVHSMDIAAALGAERLREIMAELVDGCAIVVRRYGGTVDKFTGDGIMALFGAPVALEDHAFRACLAALDVQREAQRLSAEVERRDGIALQLRVGVNSGQVIAGEIGSGPLGYTAIGEQVGMAQRMESVAPPGGVMLGESTARLVQSAVVLEEPELVHIKGTDTSVPARRLLAVGEHEPSRRTESPLVGRTWEISTVTAILEEARGGAGCVVNIMGPAGIGKSRLVRESAAIAVSRGVAVFTTFCESHASDIPFHVVARLLRAALGVNDLDGQAARAHIRAQVPDADPPDLLLLDDLLGIRDAAVALPDIAPDARRRRLTALVNAVALARETQGVCHRGRALDRRGQRVDACRLPYGDSADTRAGADHLPPRIPRRADPGVGRADHRAAAAERCANRGADRRATGLGCVDHRVGRADRRPRRREPVFRRGDRAGSSRTRHAARPARRLPAAR